MNFKDAARICYPHLDDAELDRLVAKAGECNCSRYQTCQFCKDEAAKDGISEPDAAVEAFTRTMEPKRDEDER